MPIRLAGALLGVMLVSGCMPLIPSNLDGTWAASSPDDPNSETSGTLTIANGQLVKVNFAGQDVPIGNVNPPPEGEGTGSVVQIGSSITIDILINNELLVDLTLNFKGQGVDDSTIVGTLTLGVGSVSNDLEITLARQ